MTAANDPRPPASNPSPPMTSSARAQSRSAAQTTKTSTSAKRSAINVLDGNKSAHGDITQTATRANMRLERELQKRVEQINRLISRGFSMTAEQFTTYIDALMLLNELRKQRARGESN